MYGQTEGQTDTPSDGHSLRGTQTLHKPARQTGEQAHEDPHQTQRFDDAGYKRCVLKTACTVYVAFWWLSQCGLGE